ncbi:MAG: hypothetical protein NTX33_15785 [Propionibacteriales bacterium]|nr:hypothetical protein [Propionibacteriales bacterium]
MTWVRGLMVFALTITLAGCTAARVDGPDHEGTAGADGHLATLWEGPAPSLVGTLYVLAGPDEYSANVLEVDLADGTVRRLTENPEGYGVSSFAASPGGVALATAENGSDQLRVIALGESAMWGRASASEPSIDRRGRVLVARGTDTGSAIDLYEPGEPRRMMLPNDPRDPGAVWGPRGSVLVAGPTDPAAAAPTLLQVYDDRGRLVRNAGRPGGHFGLLANPYPDRQPVTGVRSDKRMSGFVFSDDLTRVTPVPRAWRIGCWDPDGNRLLVLRGKTIGIWDPSHTQEVEITATSTVDVLACSWLRRPAGGVRSLSR